MNLLERFEKHEHLPELGIDFANIDDWGFLEKRRILSAAKALRDEHFIVVLDQNNADSYIHYCCCCCKGGDLCIESFFEMLLDYFAIDRHCFYFESFFNACNIVY